jgi:hypothetical protein
MTPSQLLERFGIPISETERQTRLSRHAMRLIDAGTAPDYMAKMWAVRYPNIEIPPKTAQINEAINELRRECQDWHEVAERLQSAYETIRAVRKRGRIVRYTYAIRSNFGPSVCESGGFGVNWGKLKRFRCASLNGFFR